MTVLDIISIVQDNQIVNIVKNYILDDDYILTRYDGKDSIPDEYNNRLVKELYTSDNRLVIVVEQKGALQ